MTDCDLLCLDLDLAERLRDELIEPALAAAVATEAKGLADPTRVAIGTALRSANELCVCDLSWVLGRPENAVSHHLQVMRAAGLAARRRNGKMVLYSLTARGSALLETLAASRQTA